MPSPAHPKAHFDSLVQSSDPVIVPFSPSPPVRDRLACSIDYPPVLSQNDWFVALDLQDTYFYMVVLLSHRKFLQFIVAEHRFQYMVLPFYLLSFYQMDDCHDSIPPEERNLPIPELVVTEGQGQRGNPFPYQPYTLLA